MLNVIFFFFNHIQGYVIIFISEDETHNKNISHIRSD